jgi:general secretion pathway protein D
MRQITSLLRAGLGVFMLWAALGGAASAAESEVSRVTSSFDAAGYATADLADLLSEVGRKSNKQFLVDMRVPAKVVVGTLDPQRVTYPLLLSILRNNGCTAVTVQGMVNIVPAPGVRTYALPIVNKDDNSIADDEYITRIIRLKQAEAAQLVPILRPLLPQEGHLAAMQPSNSLIIVDRYANVKRIAELVQSLDVAPTRPPQ